MTKYSLALVAALVLITGCVQTAPTNTNVTNRTNSTTNTTVVTNTTVGDGGTCPVDGPFEVGVDSDNKYCVCPDGYEKSSDVIGYETCYDGAECPILEVECVKGTDTTVEVGPSDDDLTSLVAAGELYNEDYSYIIEVGAEHVPNITEVAIVPFDGVTATYLYCYDTTEIDLASFDCPGTAAEAFRINVYTTAQYDDIADFSYGTLITETAGYVYELTHPNGLLPVNVPADNSFYDTIVSSFHFAG